MAFADSYVTLSDPLSAYADVLDAATRLLETVTEDDLERPGLGDWSVRRLVSHLADIADIYATLAESGTIRTDAPVYDDPVSAVAEHGGRARAAFARPGYLEEVAPTPIGRQPGSVVVQHVVNELVMHVIDLARALDRPSGVDDALTQRTLDSWRAFFAAYPRSGMAVNFAQEEAPPPDASAEARLGAYLGRR